MQKEKKIATRISADIILPIWRISRQDVWRHWLHLRPLVAITAMSPCRPKQTVCHSITYLRSVRLSHIPELSTTGAYFSSPYYFWCIVVFPTFNIIPFFQIMEFQQDMEFRRLTEEIAATAGGPQSPPPPTPVCGGAATAPLPPSSLYSQSSTSKPLTVPYSVPAASGLPLLLLVVFLLGALPAPHQLDRSLAMVSQLQAFNNMGFLGWHHLDLLLLLPIGVNHGTQCLVLHLPGHLLSHLWIFLWYVFQ